jgi:hypothetical protein
MSSTHSDLNSEKVYRQPEESTTIQDVIAAWKKVLPKVEELMKGIGTHHQSCVARPVDYPEKGTGVFAFLFTITKGDVFGK